MTVASLMTLVAGLSEFGLGNIGVREYSTLGREARMDLIRNLMGLRLALTVLGLLVALDVRAPRRLQHDSSDRDRLVGRGSHDPVHPASGRRATGFASPARMGRRIPTFFARRPPSCSWLRSWRSGPDCCRSSLRRYQ